MLAEARRLLAGIHLISARAEGLPLRDAVAGLVTCGTAFHWFPPVPAMAEIERVLAPGGWVALFWRYEAPGEPYMAVVGECLREIGVAVPGFGSDLQVHPAEPFAGSRLVPEATLTLASELEFTVDSFHGYVSTVEWIRRLAGPRHEELLRRLREELARRWPAGFRERTHEYLFCASRPAGAHR
jgi:ubiquinone/menaquinone biosynthesis C-methylase UbiE